jgi:hypothetical protein
VQYIFLIPYEERLPCQVVAMFESLKDMHSIGSHLCITFTTSSCYEKLPSSTLQPYWFQEIHSAKANVRLVYL